MVLHKRHVGAWCDRRNHRIQFVWGTRLGRPNDRGLPIVYVGLGGRIGIYPCRRQRIGTTKPAHQRCCRDASIDPGSTCRETSRTQTQDSKRDPTHKVVMLHHISDKKHNVHVPFLINHHLSTLHLPFVPTFHTHDRPDGVIGGCFPIIRCGPDT